MFIKENGEWKDYFNGKFHPIPKNTFLYQQLEFREALNNFGNVLILTIKKDMQRIKEILVKSFRKGQIK